VSLLGGIVVRPPGVVLDLNGVVKAMTVDTAVGLIAGTGFVSAGGDVATRDGVVVGLPGGGSVRLEHGGLATSGTARRWWRGGAEQHHLIDPPTGRPADSPWYEVTVAGGSCLAADVAAKAAFLLGVDGPEWLDARGLPGRFVGSEVIENEHWRAALGHAPAAVGASL
jgi:thiamine biosynthesis lipoprotein